ncbi:uncharacterized protein YgiB involved in biofilm formation [Pararhizobium capsulatum DSM 1112]|uniref:Uncharacterized protein YgiB involved in biofilm formation n=1 Tax=Pararhizobium capsulatum DSM 1112 TaxID=1121113 RepID=A0ABU0BVY7_9HYPH|nr:hypothetical protein [Pararhizobium capsulatum]MDQ0322421.1 uncharacterized protein YgiB involved in biofilm formation [Pararhizobium capsulatum DSM 1112]
MSFAETKKQNDTKKNRTNEDIMKIVSVFIVAVAGFMLAGCVSGAGNYNTTSLGADCTVLMDGEKPLTRFYRPKEVYYTYAAGAGCTKIVPDTEIQIQKVDTISIGDHRVVMSLKSSKGLKVITLRRERGAYKTTERLIK